MPRPGFQVLREHSCRHLVISGQRLPSELLKFSINAVQDTLPHNVNLARWRKNECLSPFCKLCGEKQTLIHVLNSCPKALSLCCYNEGHDAVLDGLANCLHAHYLRGISSLLTFPIQSRISFHPTLPKLMKDLI